MTDWRAGVLAGLRHTTAFRAPRPVATRDGAWRAGEWEAWEWVPGRSDPTRVEDVIRVGTAFHRAVAHLDRPASLDTVRGVDADRSVDADRGLDADRGVDADRGLDAWDRADRMAWGAEPLPREPSLDRLAAAFRPVRAPSQLVHRDLLGNVLFADGRPPAVIDWSPTWRPAAFGAAIAAVDAVCWHGLPVGRLDGLGDLALDGLPSEDAAAAWPQLLIRALAFRIATLHLLGGWDAAGTDRHRQVIDALV